MIALLYQSQNQHISRDLGLKKKPFWLIKGDDKKNF